MSDRLKEIQRRYDAKHAALAAIVHKDSDEPLSDDDKEKFGAIKAELESMKQLMALMKEVRDLEADEAEPVEDEEKSFEPVRRSVAAPAVHRRAKPVAKGIRAARYAIASAVAKMNGSAISGVRFAEDKLEDVVVAKALNTLTQGDGGALIPQDFAAELIDLARAKSVVRNAGAYSMPMAGGQLTLPRLRAGATAQWQDEVTPIAESQQQFDNLYFTAKKLTALVPVSRDAIRRSPLSIEGIVLRDMTAQIALAEDKAFLFGPGTALQPAGIDTLVAAGNKFTNAVTAPVLGTVNDVLMSLELALQAKNIDTGSAVFFFHPAVRSFLSTLTDSTGRYFFRDELEAGRLIGYPVHTSTQFDTNLGTGPNFQTKIIFAAMADVIHGDTLNVEVETSTEASYGSANGNSAFTRDEMLFRVITETDQNIKHDVSAAVATVTNWRPTGFTAAAGTSVYTQAANTTGTSAKSAKP